MKTTTTTKYICEVCGKESVKKNIISQCEISHKCDHKYRYAFDYTIDAIRAKCIICGFKDAVDLDDWEEMLTGTR